MSYVPTWVNECDDLFQQYKEVEDPDDIKTTASNLIDKLNEKRQGRWEEAVAEVDFTHSSQKAWLNTKRLTGRNTAKKHFQDPPNVIAKQIVSNGIYHGADKSFQREVKRNVTQMRQRSHLPEEDHPSLDFFTDEIKSSLLSTQLGKSTRSRWHPQWNFNSPGTKIHHLDNTFFQYLFQLLSYS